MRISVRKNREWNARCEGLSIGRCFGEAGGSGSVQSSNLSAGMNGRQSAGFERDRKRSDSPVPLTL